jgi:hypothetical protein
MVRNAMPGLAWPGENLKSSVGMPNEYARDSTRSRATRAMVRFSNGTNHVGSDRFLGPITTSG